MIVMNTGGYSCPWDSGQVGFIYVEKAKLRNYFGWKKITKRRVAQAKNWLEAEVLIYDQYLRGEVYSVSVADDEGEALEYMGGIYGLDLARVELKVMVNYLKGAA